MRYALGVEYDGTNYYGWQRQDGVVSIQAEVEAAISKVADHSIEVVCAGRTDKGVHALQQVVHFDTHAVRNNDAWLMGINRYLPPTINVHWIKSVEQDFHARFSAQARRYGYVMYCHPMRSSLMRDHVTWIYRKLDVPAMKQAAQYLIGEHDFSSFRGKDCQAKTTIRTILHLNLIEKKPLLIIDIKANAFLHNMVRNITGSLLAVGLGHKEPEWLRDVIIARDRKHAAMTAPATGLHFLGVDYPAQFNIPALPHFIWFAD